jgi:hypothetical protein
VGGAIPWCGEKRSTRVLLEKRKVKSRRGPFKKGSWPLVNWIDRGKSWQGFDFYFSSVFRALGRERGGLPVTSETKLGFFCSVLHLFSKDSPCLYVSLPQGWGNMFEMAIKVPHGWRENLPSYKMK